MYSLYTPSSVVHHNGLAVPRRLTLRKRACDDARLAMDVYETLTAHHIPIDTVVAHSFGGKVAMELMSLYSLNLPSLPKTAIILDISAFSMNPFLHPTP